MSKYKIQGNTPSVDEIAACLRQALPEYPQIDVDRNRVVLTRDKHYETHCYAKKSLIKVSSHFPYLYRRVATGLFLVSIPLVILLFVLKPAAAIVFLLLTILPASGLLNFLLITTLPARQRAEAEIITAMQERWPPI